MNYKSDVDNRWKWQLLFVLGVAILMRVVFYTGVFGSDELASNQSAFMMLHQNSSDVTYLGSIRYGAIIPVALSFFTFGVSEFSANIWPILCAFLEVLIAYLIARRLFDNKTAFLSAMLLATVPLHVHFAGRMASDSPLTLFTALAFYLFILAEQQNNKYKYFFSGISLGFTYWTKASVTVLLAPVFLFYALTTRKFKINWLFFVIGGGVVWLGHFMFMWFYHGDFFHHLNVILNSVDKFKNIENEFGPLYYLEKLFVDVKHLWLLGPLAILGLLHSRKCLNGERKLILMWLLFLVSLLSMLPIKQNNYMLLFMLPLSIFAALGIESIKWDSLRKVTIFVWLLFSIILSGLKQQDIRNYVSNSKALHYFALAHENDIIYGSQKAANIHSVLTLLETGTKSKTKIRVLQDENDFTPGFYISFDNQTQDELLSQQIRHEINRQGMCLHPLDKLEPTGFGIGRIVLTNLQLVATFVLPSAINSKVNPKLNEYVAPKVMTLFWVDSTCV